MFDRWQTLIASFDYINASFIFIIKACNYKNETGSYHLYRRCQSRTTISITIKKNDYLCRTLGRNMTEGLAVLIIANVANAMKTIKAVRANKGRNQSFLSQCCACSAYSCRHNN